MKDTSDGTDTTTALPLDEQLGNVLDLVNPKNCGVVASERVS